MIRVFVKDEKVNFVDDKNRLVGFNNEDDCCAHGGWFITPDRVFAGFEERDMKAPQTFPEYVFDTEFFAEAKYPDNGIALAVFRMVADEKPDLYLHLYNCHNGYYARGFDAEFMGKEGYL